MVNARARLHVCTLAVHALGTAALRELATGEAGVAEPVRGSGAPSGSLAGGAIIGAAHAQAHPSDTQGHSIRRRHGSTAEQRARLLPFSWYWYKAGLVGGRAGYCSGFWPDLLIWGWPGTLGRILMSAAGRQRRRAETLPRIEERTG